MNRVSALAAALLLAACGSPDLPPPAASAEQIEEAVNNAERELAAAKAGSAQGGKGGLIGA